MATIAWISAATVAGGVISIAIAAMFALSAPASWVPALVSFAIGTLLGAVFLEILPHAIGSAGNLQALLATVLAGILGFFILEKLVLWRHCHVEDCDGRGPRNLRHGNAATARASSFWRSSCCGGIAMSKIARPTTIAPTRATAAAAGS